MRQSNKASRALIVGPMWGRRNQWSPKMVGPMKGSAPKSQLKRIRVESHKKTSAVCTHNACRRCLIFAWSPVRCVSVASEKEGCRFLCGVGESDMVLNMVNKPTSRQETPETPSLDGQSIVFSWVGTVTPSDFAIVISYFLFYSRFSPPYHPSKILFKKDK